MPKEYIIKSIIIVSLMLVFVSAPVLYHLHTSFWIYNVEYEECVDEFNCVKDYILTLYPDEEDKCILVTHYQDNICLTDLDTGRDLDNDEEIQEALKKIISEGFVYKGANLDAIRIQGERVSFDDDGPYKFVYSPNGRPKYFSSKDEDEKIAVKKEADGWYHIRLR